MCVCLFREVNILFDISHSYLTLPRCYLFEQRSRNHLPPTSLSTPPPPRPPALHPEFFHSENTRLVSRSYKTLLWLRDFDIPFAFLSACPPRILHCDTMRRWRRMIRLGNKVSGKKNTAETLRGETMRDEARRCKVRREDAKLTSPRRTTDCNFVNYFKYAAVRFCNTDNDEAKKVFALQNGIFVGKHVSKYFLKYLVLLLLFFSFQEETARPI